MRLQKIKDKSSRLLDKIPTENSPKESDVLASSLFCDGQSHMSALREMYSFGI